MNVELLGFIAGAICTCAIFPQIYKAAKTGSTTSLSWGMICVNLAGCTLYMVYGLLIHKPAIWTNLMISLVANMIVGSQKLYYEHWKKTDIEMGLIIGPTSSDAVPSH
jgi:MtN3 and saliva related transmembrane protein